MIYTSEVLQLKTYSDGVSMQFKYLNSGTKPVIVNNNVSNWKDEIPSLNEGERLYMIQKKSNETNWSAPIQMSAKDGTTPTISIVKTENGNYWMINGEVTDVRAEGEPGRSPEVKIGNDGNWYIDGKDSGTKAQGPNGVDGDSVEYVYYRSNVEVTELLAPSYTNGQLPDGWKPSPQGISEDYKFEYVSIRTKSAGSWSGFSEPVIWSKWGERGMDGDGVEYKYCLTDSTEKPIYPAPAGTDYVWTDEPTGVSIEKRYEYVVSLVISPVEAYAKKINTEIRNFPLEGGSSWSFYGKKGHEENWTIRGTGNLDNSHIYLGDYAYVEGFVQGTETPVKLYGKVIELYDSSAQDGHIKMRSTHLVVGNYSTPTSNVSLWSSYSPGPLVGIRNLTYVADQTYRNTFSYGVTVYDPDLGESVYVDSTATGGNVTKDLSREPKVGETYETNLKSGNILYRTLYKILYVGTDESTGERDYVAKTLSTDRITGETGGKGDTINVVYAYFAKGNITTPTTVPNGSTLNGWSLTPVDATVSKPYVFVCQCTVTNENYGAWSSPKVWAKFGKDGTDGTDATVTPENVFNALTDDGTKFDCFYDKDGKLYINALFINTQDLTADWVLSKRVIAQNLDAGTGNIAGWKIAENSITTEKYGLGIENSFHMYSEGFLTNDASSTKKYFGQTSNLTWCLGIGQRFGVTKSGQLFATDAYLTNVNAKSGYIGGWNIISNELYYRQTGIYSGSQSKVDSAIPGASPSPVRFYAGNSNRTDAEFKVLEDGSLYASAANITGKISANEGDIAGWEILPDTLKKIGPLDGSQTYYPNSIILKTDTDQTQNALIVGQLDTDLNPLPGAFCVSNNGACYMSSGRLGNFDVSAAGLTCEDNSSRLSIDGFSIYVSRYPLNNSTVQRESNTKELILTYGSDVEANSGAIMIRPSAVTGGTSFSVKVYRNEGGSSIYGAAFTIECSSTSKFKPKSITLYWAVKTKGVKRQSNQSGQVTITLGSVSYSNGKYYAYGGFYKDYKDFGCDILKTDYIGFSINSQSAAETNSDAQDWEIENNDISKVLGTISCELDDNEANYTVEVKGHLVPYGNGQYDLGTEKDLTSVSGNAQKRWRNGYFTGDVYGLQWKSDARAKNSILPLSSRYEVFFDKMMPSRYKYNEGTSDRYHTGFIAQQLVTALEESELTTKDFAGVVLLSPGTENECWYLRRDEFVALNTWQIQKLKPRVSALEQTILNYESRVSALETEIQNLKS